MNFQEQVDKLSNTSLLAESTPWQFQRYGEQGLFLNSPGISLADVKHFLAELLGSSDLLKILAPAATDLWPPLPLDNLHLDSLALTRTWDEEAYELKLNLRWDTHTATVDVLSDPPINFDLAAIRASIHIVRPQGSTAQQQFDVVLTADMQFNHIPFEVDIQLPALIFSATLGDRDAAPTESHQAVIKQFLPHAASTDSQPHLESLGLTIALRQRRVIFYFAVANLFKLTPLNLREIQTDIIYDPDSGKPSGQLWADVEIDLGSSRPPIEMLLLAELTPDSHWQFAGQTGPGEINVKDLLDGLMTLFPSDIALEVPDAIAHLKIAHLGLTHNTDGGAFGFDAEIKFQVSSDEPEVDILLHIEIASAEKGHAKELTAKIRLAGHEFDLAFASDPGDTETEAISVFVATYSEPHSLSLNDMISTVTSTDIGDLLPPLTIQLDQVRFAYVKEGNKSAALFGISLEANMTLDGLPLVGHALPPDISIDGVQVLYATSDVSGPQANVLNDLLPEGGKLPPSPQLTTPASTTGKPPTALQHGFNFAAQLNLGIGTLPILANGSSRSDAQPAALPASTSAGADTPAASPPPSDNVMWFDVQRNLGPIALKRVGARYADNRLWFLLSADLNMSTFTIGLLGLGVGFQVGHWLEDIKPTLSGLSLSYKSGPVEISGAFEKSGDDYLGAATIKAGTYALSAIGAYGQSEGETTLFIFAMLTEPPLGGPAFFYVTGLAIGFGYNRDVRIPTVDQMPQFPLVSAMMPEAKDAVTLIPDAADPMKTLGQISTGGWIPKAPGQNWLAVGVRFTSFEMVQSFALATVKFGTRFEVAIVGLSQLTIPAPDPASGAAAPDRIAYAEVAFSARLIPDEGILRVDGKLTPASYILVKEAQPKGGFAFYVWADGDFVISFGGYHPHFAQGHYPDVPRLEIDFYIGSSLHVTAKAYFALTPSAIMAGGYLDATWDSGPLQAWFKAGADFLLMWKPFRYEVAIFVHIGASFTLDFAFFSVSVTVELGADLELWGPPLGGTATITYSIASFTIGFGADRLPAPPLSWPQFRDQFLPTGGVGDGDEPQRNGALLNARVSKGLVEDLSQKQGTANPHSLSWAVNPDGVIVEVTTAVPATAVSLNDSAQPLPKGHYVQPLHIGPMQQNGLNYTAPLTVRVEYFDAMAADMDSPGELYPKVTAEIILGTSPKALWSDYDPLGHEVPLSQAESRIQGTITTVRIQPVTTEPEETPTYHLKDLLFEEHEIERVAMFGHDDAFAHQPLTTPTAVTADIARNDTRAAILQALQTAGVVDSAVTIDLTQLANQPGIFTTQPRKRTFHPEEAVR